MMIYMYYVLTNVNILCNCGKYFDAVPIDENKITLTL